MLLSHSLHLYYNIRILFVCVFLPTQGRQDESELEDTGKSKMMYLIH